MTPVPGSVPAVVISHFSTPPPPAVGTVFSARSPTAKVPNTGIEATRIRTLIPIPALLIAVKFGAELEKPGSSIDEPVQVPEVTIAAAALAVL